VLVPTIAGALARGDKKEAASKTSYSFLISTLLILPCCIGFIVLAKPIYMVIYHNAPLGYDLLALMSVSLIFSALAQTVNGSLQGIGKVFVPAMGLLVGCVIKVILNLTLIRIPSVNIYGAAISSIVCQIVAFIISFVIMRRYIRLEITPMKYVIKPVASALIMGAAAFSVYKLVYAVLGTGFMSNLIGVVAAVVVAVIVYAALIFGLRILDKEEIELLPSGAKLYRLLVKIGIYK
jgi:stage V sporulation protein B